TLGLEYTPKFESAFANDDPSFFVTFLDFVPQFRDIAVDCFSEFVKQEKQKMDDKLNMTNALRTVSWDANFQNYSAVLRRVALRLRELHLLWTGLLPTAVMFSLLAHFADHAIDYVLSCIFRMEDIPERDCGRLNELLGILVNHLPKCFTDDDKIVISRYSARWRALNEMSSCLSCDLQRFADRWASGNGPLAKCFSSDQVRHLIRAVFQNTRNRADVLALIK
ncbi:unnamed protein product, partial [Soboliphyme baturini]|uniref:Rab-GAP TBC domain-containing protein n=1 Tax=Soboliphyme baturini TaxID=241478 RepID=A0A183IQU9_9BILA